MKLTTKGRYAVTAMLDLALHQGKGPITLSDIAQRQGISLSYLEQLFSRLRKQQLVSSVRGPGGGYCLARSATEISIANILNAVDDMVKRQEVTSPETELPGSMMMWQRLSNQVYDYLDGITLADAVESAITMLDAGEVRVAEKKDGQWQVNQWLKKAVLLSFRLNDGHHTRDLARALERERALVPESAGVRALERHLRALEGASR